MKGTAMRPVPTIGLVVLAAWLLPATAQDNRPEAGGLRAPIERFDTTLSLTARNGQGKTLRVVVRNWIIDSRRTIAAFPERGFMVVELRGGDLTTVIGGQRQRRSEGEFWSVPAGTPMGVETGNDSAVIQTVSTTELR